MSSTETANPSRQAREEGGECDLCDAPATNWTQDLVKAWVYSEAQYRAKPDPRSSVRVRCNEHYEPSQKRYVRVNTVQEFEEL